MLHTPSRPARGENQGADQGEVQHRLHLLTVENEILQRRVLLLEGEVARLHQQLSQSRRKR